MCNQGDTVLMRLPDPQGWPNHLNGQQWDVDHCIAPIVAALNNASIYTASSCCGHNKELGHIWLQDGRALVILPNDTTKDELVEAVAHLMECK